MISTEHKMVYTRLESGSRMIGIPLNDERIRLERDTYLVYRISGISTGDSYVRRPDHHSQARTYPEDTERYRCDTLPSLKVLEPEDEACHRAMVEMELCYPSIGGITGPDRTGNRHGTEREEGRDPLPGTHIPDQVQDQAGHHTAEECRGNMQGSAGHNNE